MFIIRPVTKKDKDIFLEFSSTETVGIRNLHHHKNKIEEMIELSENSFSKTINKPNREEYVFVMEDLSTRVIGGTCGILSSTDPQKTCNYKIETFQTNPSHPSISKEIKILKLASKPIQASEICSLYLHPSFRHSGQGRLLSLSRFLFIACHPKRFRRKIVAELRGYIDEKQISPFWNAVGKHFCSLSFVELMEQIELNNIAIHEIIPPFPLYYDLLPKEAQEVIGQVHDQSKPAQNMLFHEGFQLTKEVDAFEAGPSMVSSVSQIRTIRESRLIQIDITSEKVEGPEFILSNCKIDFRACYGAIKFINKSKCIINQEIAEALHLKTGQTLRYVTPH